MKAEDEDELDVQFALMEEQFNSNMEAFFSQRGINRSEFQQKAMMLQSRLEKALDLMMDGEDEMTDEELAECNDVLGKCRMDKTSLKGELDIIDLLLA